MPAKRSFVGAASVAAVASASAGIVGGFLANRWSWGLLAATLTLIAVFAGLEGLKVIMAARAQSASPPAAPAPPAGPAPAAAPRRPGSVSLSASGGSVTVSGSNIAAGDQTITNNQTRIHTGGLAAVIVAALLLLGTGGGTLALATSGDGRFALGPDTTPSPSGSAVPQAVAPATAEVAPTSAPPASLASGDRIVDLSAVDGQVKDVVSDGSTVSVSRLTPAPEEADVTLDTYDISTGDHLAGPIVLDPRTEWACGIASVRPAGRSLLLDYYKTEEPAKGIYPATWSHHLRAVDARSLATVWTAPIIEDSESSPSQCEGTLSRITDDGRHGLFQLGDHQLLFHLVDGTASKVTGPATLVGDYLVTGKAPADNPGGLPEKLRVLDPASRAARGSVTDPAVIRQIMTPDGYTVGGDVLAVFVDGATSSDHPGDLIGLSWPSGRYKWSSPERIDHSGGVTYENEAGLFFTNDPGLMAISADTGKTAWGPIENVGLCQTAGDKLHVYAKGQLAVLDTATGAQESYRDATACPWTTHGIRWDPSDGVYRL